MSYIFFAHAALLGSSCSSRTDVYAPGTLNLVSCLDKKYLLKIRNLRLIFERKYLLKNIYISVEIFV